MQTNPERVKFKDVEFCVDFDISPRTGHIPFNLMIMDTSLPNNEIADGENWFVNPLKSLKSKLRDQTGSRYIKLRSVSQVLVFKKLRNRVH